MGKILFDDNWGFTENFDEAILSGDYNDANLTPVCLPHTCAETPFHYFDESAYQMVSAYRKVFEAKEEWQGKRVFVTFEAVAHVATVYLNGKKLAEHGCGYTAFTVELTEGLKYGEKNILVVQDDSRESVNVPPFGNVIDYMTYGGIYRDVYLEVKNQVYITDVFANIMDVKESQVTFSTEISYSDAAVNKTDDYMTKQVIVLEDGTEQELQTDGKPQELLNITLWTPENPKLYEIRTRLYEGSVLIDELSIRTGFRTVEFKTDGFYLNHKKIKLRGLNRHQCYPYVGYAMPKRPQQLDADICKRELGLNIVRTSHYPQSQYFVSRCDEIGLLVFTEIPGWQHIGDDAWKEQACKNVEEMVMQYRNHPSIILWGVRINESKDDDDFYIRTNKIAHGLDNSRATGGVRNTKKSHLFEDVYTYNDFLHNGIARGAEKKKDVTPDRNKPYMVSEFNGHMYPTKAFDTEDHRTEHGLRHTNVLEAVYSMDDIAGCIGWCMFDYNTHKDFGSGDRICYHGVMDMFRNPKLAAAVYASQSEENDVFEVSSSMDIGEHPACYMGDIYAYTNADSVKLYKNDRFIKEFFPDNKRFKDMPHPPVIIDDFIGNLMVEQEGFSVRKSNKIKKLLNAFLKYGMDNMPLKYYLLAVDLMVLHHMTFEDGYRLNAKYLGNWGEKVTTYRFEAIKNGVCVKSVQKTPMHEIQLKLNVDSTLLSHGNTYDVATIRMQAEDENGNVMPFFGDIVEMKVEGGISLIGPAQSVLRGGMGGTYVKTNGTSNTGVLTICCRGTVQSVNFEIEM